MPNLGAQRGESIKQRDRTRMIIREGEEVREGIAQEKVANIEVPTRN